MYDYAPGICSGNRCYGTKTTLTVTGKVTDLEGDPLSGVSVVVQEQRAARLPILTEHTL